MNHQIKLSEEDYDWYQRASYRRRDLQNATQRAANDHWQEAELVAPDGTVLFTAAPRKE